MSGAGYGRIGPYELRGILGRGGMATVYRAHAPNLGRDVALKVLTAPEEKLDLLRERFRRESRTIGRLQHPHILALLDSGEENGIPYLVMELIEGGALNSRLGRPLPPREAVEIAKQIGRALDYAHAQGVVHRDVKPANIFLQRSPQGTRAVLADFGIAKVFGELGPKLTQTGVGIGTPEYTAPEQAMGEPVDGRSDLYALGIVLYEMLTGQPPYQGGTMDVISAHVQGQLPDPRSRNTGLPPAVSAVLVKALARQPQQRYASGAALAAALEDAITGTRGSVQLPPDADSPSPTMLLDRTRELMLQTQIVDNPPPAGIDATIVTPRPTNTPPPKAAPPVAPAALPPVPARPTGRANEAIPATEPPTRPGGARPTPAPEPPKALPPTPLATNNPSTPHPLAGPPGQAFAPPSQTLPPLTPPQQQTQLTPAQGFQPAPLYQPPGNIAPPTPPPPVAQGRGNLPLLIGLGGALVVLLIMVGVGGIYLFRRESNTTPTATVASSAPPTTTVAAAASGTPVGAVGTTPAVPPQAATATAALAADPARTQIATGEAALQGGQFPQAIATYKEALAINPQSAIANRQLGLALWVWNHEPGEIGYLDQATKLDPNDAVAWAYLSFSSVDTHQVERAYAAAQRAVAANSNQAEAYAAVANCYVRYPPEPANPESGKREAREAIDKAKQLDPTNLWVLWVEHIVLSNEEKYEAAIAPLDQMIAQRPNWATLLYAKGGLYYALERPAEAKTWQEASLKLDPEYPYALTELGWLAYDEGDYPRARDFFNRALALTDDVNDRAHIGLGYTLAQEGDYTNALLHCQRATSIDTRLPGGYSCLGYLYRVGTQQYTESLAAYRKVLELRPYWEDGHVGIALVQASQNTYTEAEATLKQGLLQITKPRYAQYWLGWVLYQQGKYQEAQPNFEKAAELVPNDSGVQYQLGQNLEQLQRYPEARAAYERALAIDPNYTEARQALDRLAQQGR